MLPTIQEHQKYLAMKHFHGDLWGEDPKWAVINHPTFLSTSYPSILFFFLYLVSFNYISCFFKYLLLLHFGYSDCFYIVSFLLLDLGWLNSELTILSTYSVL